MTQLNGRQALAGAERARVYFDHAASSPMTQACRDAFVSYDRAPWAGANPNSLHTSGRQAFEVLEAARASLARCVGASRPSEVVFTSGGTEANNLAVCGIARATMRASGGKRRRVLVFSIEHDSVLDAAARLVSSDDMSVERIPSLPNGTVDLDALERALDNDVALVSVMAANNEVGTVQPLDDVVRLAHEKGAYVHTDAVQAFGHVPFSVGELGVDAASLAAHKLGGPVGIGALYLRARTPLEPLQLGGGQESGRRSGTPDVRCALAFAAVARDAVENLEMRGTHVRKLAQYLVEALCNGPDAVARPSIPGPRDARLLPGIVHLLVPGHQTEGLVLALDERGFETSGGSACSSGSLEPSHVLLAMGIPRDLAFCALRLSFDHRCTLKECTGLVDALRETCSAQPRRRRSR